MSTRSKKRIQNSFQDNILKPELEVVVNSERKTRSKRLKENIEEVVISAVKSKKRTNYVSYPTDDENGTDCVDSKEDESKTTRLLRKNALKERNGVTPLETVDENIDARKSVRSTRRTRKFPEEEEQIVEEVVTESNETQKSKKGKKKKNEEAKKKLKKKKVRGSGSMVVEEVETDKNSLNKSNASIDSFHSAAGSPVLDKNASLPKEKSPQNIIETSVNDHAEGKLRRRTRSVSKVNGTLNTSIDLQVSRKRKSSVKDNNIDKETEIEPMSKKRKSLKSSTEMKNTTFEFDNDEKSIKNTTFAKIETVNTTYDKDTSKLETEELKDTTFDKEEIVEIPTSSAKKTRKSIINTTYEKYANNSLIDINTRKSIHNTTYEKSSDNSIQEIEPKSSIQNETFDKDISELNSKSVERKSSSQKSSSTEINTTFNKKEESADKISLDSTYDKDKNLNTTFDKDKKLNTTFDKTSKSSLLSSDNSNLDKSNISMDKSEISRISITSDESKENIVNMTPVLIESSLDESQIQENGKDLSNMGLIKKTPSPKVLQSVKSPSFEGTNSNLTEASTSKTPTPALNREGTFTKESPEVSASPKPKTPLKRLSLPSPGCTPFPTKVSREMLNVTRSLEKSRRSSLTEPLPRLTKVMFCSPVNNPVVVMQQKRKVIKSNLKGSNKSFVFDDSASTVPRAAPRKRSYTHNDAEPTRVKRTRLADATLHSVERLSRPRTTSATAKLSEVITPTKKTPTKKNVRTKLPNFAALHQREFDKMENLRECQERKARRAKQLLTPTGAVTVLERNSPRDNTPEPPKPQSQQKPKQQKQSKQQNEPKKPETPVKSLPPLKSLNPGYSRFGFKLNLDANPFSVPSKMTRSEGNLFNFSTKKDKPIFEFTSKDSKEVKLKRQVTAPSLTGATLKRREVAKQTVMREKSFTAKRKEVRNENRTIIKGVRTNRRFELQMRMRDLE